MSAVIPTLAGCAGSCSKKLFSLVAVSVKQASGGREK